MFNQVISVFQGFFAKAFWFGSFLPVAIFAFLNFAIAAIVFPDRVRFWEWLNTPVAAAGWVPAAFALMIVSAYALTPLIPLFRGWLDGSSLPPAIHDALRRSRVIQVRDALAEIDTAMRAYGTWAQVNGESLSTLSTSREAGKKLQTAKDRPSIERAQKLTQKLRKQIDRVRLPTSDETKAAVEAVTAALKANTAGLPSTHADAKLSGDLEQTQLTLIRLLRDTLTEARHRFFIASIRHSAMALEDPQATRVGDARTLAESYSWNVYGVDFDFVWPRLQLILPDKDSFVDKMTEARAQIDFAVLCLVLTIAIPLIWLPLLAITASAPWVFLGLGALVPLLARFFYELVVQSQTTFGEIVKGAIDKFRLDLLTKVLMQPMPATRVAERELWQNLRRAEEFRTPIDIIYRQSPR
jgi:hypothetical protein